MVLPSLIMFFGSKEKNQNIAVTDESGIVFPRLESDEYMTFTDCSADSVDYLKASLDSLGYKALVCISAIDSTNSVKVSSYSYKPVGMEVTSKVKEAVDEAVEDYRIKEYGVEGLREIIDSVGYSSEITSYTIGEDGSENVTITELYRFIAMVFSMLIYIFIYSFGGMVMSAVINEKTSRVVEVMVSSVKAVDLMVGKILGIAAVAMTQFLLWIVLTVAIILGVSSFIGAESVEGAADIAAMGTDAEMMTGVMNSEVASVMSTLSQIDFPLIVGSFLIFFIFGYLLYSSMFAAIGSAVENESDTQQLLIPVTIPILAAFFISLSAFENPDSSLLIWASYIPFTSPICMMTRIVNGVASWEIWISVAVLVATTVLMMYVSAKIYKVGILMFGKKSSFKDMWRWLKYK